MLRKVVWRTKSQDHWNDVVVLGDHVDVKDGARCGEHGMREAGRHAEAQGVGWRAAAALERACGAMRARACTIVFTPGFFFKTQ